VKTVGAVLVVALSLSVNAQQQRLHSPSSWPCGARVDSSYFRVAEGTGGHLLLLAPEEIGDSATLLTALGAHPQTIFRLAGSVTTGLHEFEVPIDSSVESVLFSISVQCLHTAEVVRPSGALAVGDDATLLPNFRAQHVVIVKRPEPGTWTLRVAGSGIAAMVVQAQSAIGMSQPEFASALGAPFSRVPVAGVENIATLQIGGRVSDVHATLVSGQFVSLGDLPLEPGERDGAYVSRFTPGAQPFRVLVTGRDADGVTFQRMSAALVAPMR